MGDDAAHGDSGQPASTPGQARLLRRAALVLLVAATAAAWVTVARLEAVPRVDGAGRMVVYYAGGHTSAWWLGVAVAVAAPLSLVLAAVAMHAVVRRLRGPWRLFTAVVCAGAWLCGAAYLALLVLVAVLGAGLEGRQWVVRAADGTTVMVTQDGFDGDTVDIWRPASSVVFVREPVEATVDPSSGRCRLDREAEATVRLTCGAASQRLAIDDRRP